MRRLAWALGVLLPTLSVAAGCVSIVPLVRAPAAPACAGDAQRVMWWRIPEGAERQRSEQWCAAVGPPVILDGIAGPPIGSRLIIVSWNVHVGGGDVAALVNDLRTGRLTGEPEGSFVLLLQETFRAGPEVPHVLSGGARVARGSHPGGPERRGITATARALGLSLFYAPSMRNGSPDTSDEDRGNAILSTVPLERHTAIELPLERQRRVAVAAFIRGGAGARAWTLRLVSTHFTNAVGHHWWIFSEPARVRQAIALGQALDDECATLLGGDLNTWFGYQDAAYKELARRFHARPPEDRRPTFSIMRLDHVLHRLPDGWRADTRRAPRRYGSDHYPLIDTIAVP